MLNVSYIDTAKGMWFEHVNVNDLPFQAKKQQPTKKRISTQTWQINTVSSCIIWANIWQVHRWYIEAYWGLTKASLTTATLAFVYQDHFCLPLPRNWAFHLVSLSVILHRRSKESICEMGLVELTMVWSKNDLDGGSKSGRCSTVDLESRKCWQFLRKKNASRTVWMANDYIMILICCCSSANGREWVLLFGLFNFLGTAYLSPNQLQ